MYCVFKVMAVFLLGMSRISGVMESNHESYFGKHFNLQMLADSLGSEVTGDLCFSM